MTEMEAPTCRKAGCQATATGNCAEGHSPLESCPWFGTNPPERQHGDSAEQGEEGREGSNHDFVVLPSGAPLSPQSLDEFLRARPIRLVAIVGDRDAGKTTLICAIYENFLKGRFADWLFAGSRTLIGFEERSHESRAASGRSMPDTSRTSLAEGLHFFHLGIRAAADELSPQIELILSDRAGEAFASVRDKPLTSAQLLEVIRADRIAILLDGKRVADSETRGNATRGVRSLVRALIDGGAITSNSDVQIVLTKKDLIERAEDAAAIGQEIQRFFDFLTRDFSSKMAQLTFWGIAARDPSGATESGLAPLLSNWLKVKNPEVKRSPVPGLRASEFDRLLDRSGLEYLP